MKQFAFIIYLLISTLFSFAQYPEFSAGINGGPVFSKFKILREYDFGYNVDYLTGYNTAVFIRMDLAPRVFIETEMGYYQNGYNENQESKFKMVNHTFEDSYIGHDFNDRYSYLNNMWFVGYTCNLTNKIDASASIGTYWGYLLEVNSTTRIYYYVTAEDAETVGDPTFDAGYFENVKEEPIDKSYYKNFDYGVGGRVSLTYEINSRLAILASGGYKHGLRNIIKPNDGWLEIYTRSFNLTAGLIVGF
ncbi:MAG: outer membrane beta-barrel protein [Prolixibacteraceae bacterium]|jgi:hypothetical protein|nr:outer membrane beta-barrel protein [Prolixibacteraceae bacterium]